MKDVKGKLPFSALIALVLIVSGLFGKGAEAAEPLTRAEGEDIVMELNVSFRGPLDYTIHANVMVRSLYFEEDLMNSSTLRSVVASGGSAKEEELETAISERVLNISRMSLSGDSILASVVDLDRESLDPTTGDGDGPIVLEATLDGRVEVERFIRSEKVGDIDEDRVDDLIIAFLVSGFRFQRAITLRAEPGVTVAYAVASSFSPYPDGAVTINVRNTRVPHNGPYQHLTVDGQVGVYTGPFDLMMTGSPSISTEEETITGTAMLDWVDLDTIECSADIDIASTSLFRAEIAGLIPDSVSGPSSVKAGLIRLCFLEGLLSSSERADIEGSISSEIGASLMDALGNRSITVMTTLDPGTSGMDRPDDGGSLLSVLGSEEPVHAISNLGSAVNLDILEGHAEEQVMGLLNGGMRILRDFEKADDDRFEFELIMPPDLFFYGELPKRVDEGGRMVYDHEPGNRMIASALAPNFTTERIAIDAKIDLSDVHSDYFVDTKVEAKCEIGLDLYRIKYYPDQFDLNTTIQFELDHVSSDMVRLLITMGIIGKADITQRIEDELFDMLDAFIPKEDQEIRLTLDDEYLVFDGDISNVDDMVPIHIDAVVEGTSEPFGGSGSSGEGAANIFIDHHFDPIIPFKTVKRTIEVEDLDKWEPQIRIVFPSGCGIEAWLANGSDEKVERLSVKVEGAYPTVFIERGSGSWDRVILEVTMSGWFGFNNVLACFASTIGAIVLALLLVVLTIASKVRKARKRRMEASQQGHEGDQAAAERAQRPGAKSPDAPAIKAVTAAKDRTVKPKGRQSSQGRTGRPPSPGKF